MNIINHRKETIHNFGQKEDSEQIVKINTSEEFIKIRKSVAGVKRKYSKLIKY